MVILRKELNGESFAACCDHGDSGLVGSLLVAPLEGLYGANIKVGASPYKLKFARSNRKGYKYLCMLHPFMKGKVAVRARG